MEQKKRYELIDGIRGLAMVNMVIFHFLYDVFIIYEEIRAGMAGREPSVAAGDLLDIYSGIRVFLAFWKKEQYSPGNFPESLRSCDHSGDRLAVPGQAAIFGILIFWAAPFF